MYILIKVVPQAVACPLERDEVAFFIYLKFLSFKTEEKRMKKTLKLLFGAGILMTALAACVPAKTADETNTQSESKTEALDTKSADEGAEKKDGVPTVGVVQLMDHTSLNIIYKAFSQQMEALGYKDGENINIDFKNAQGEMSNIATIMQSFKASKPDVLVPITTPVAQGAMELTETMPVVFTAVTDPVGAGLVSDFDVTDRGMTGTSDIIQVDKILDLATKITPDIKTIGYIYNAGEDNSVSNLEKLEKYAKEHNLSVETVAITSSSELQSAASTTVEKVDAIFVANDNTVAEAMPILMSVANEAKVPVYVGADSMVMDGGFATVGIDYNDLGKETANMVDQILKGKKTSEIPVKIFKDDLNIYVNTDTAAALGIEIPDEIKNDAKFVEIKNK
jgi:ABC transporter, periplasmic substrate-binding protein